MDNQKERLEKQKYLRTQVLEKGYDPDEFVDYLNQVVNIGADVDLISLKELANIAESFKRKKLEEDNNMEASKFNNVKIEKGLAESVQIMASKVQQKSSKPRLINQEKYGTTQQEMDKTFKCLNFNPKLQMIPNLKIEVSDPQRKSSGGIFGLGTTTFLLFKINTPEYNWEVRRRYSDFQWLRTIISKFFPTFIIPPIPRKNAAKRTQRDLQKRMRILTYFLNDIANIPTIFHCKYVQGFMSLTSDSKFEELKKQANNKESFQTITSIQTKTGEVNIKLSNERKTYMQEMDKFMNGAELLYKDITRNSKLLQNHFIQQTNTLYRMGNQFADLHTLMKDFNNRLPNCQQVVLNDTYITLNNMMVQWGNIVRNQHAYLQKNFNTFFRYARNEIYSFRQLWTKVDLIQQEYFKNKVMLDKKKQRIFATGDINKWEIPSNQLKSISANSINNKNEAIKIMLPKESFELDKIKMKYAFYQSQFFQHSRDTLVKDAGCFCDNFKEFAIKIKVNNQQLTELWTEIATNFADPKKKLVIQQPIVNNKEQEYQDG